MYLFFLYLAAISLLAVILTVTDKIKAIRRQWRIREAVLLLVAALGGSVAMLLTMLLIHHKTNHLKFMLGIPVIILLQVAAAILIGRWLLG